MTIFVQDSSAESHEDPTTLLILSHKWTDERTDGRTEGHGLH